MPIRVLLVSATMGAGHEGAAQELRRRLVSAGHPATAVDFLDALARPAAWAWRRSYDVQVRHFPEQYERSYRYYYSASSTWTPVLQVATAITRRRVASWIDAARPEVVVSTYPFATLVLGELRRAGVVQVPVVNFLTDLGVHPRTVHPGVDLNIAPHALSARAAEGLVDVPTVVTGPVVGPSFSAIRPSTRLAARYELGIPDEEVAVLVLGGSLAFGRVRETVDALLAAGRFRVIVVCGNDRRLQRDLRQRSGRLTVLGWTDEMAGVVAAADVVVENAGGLSAFEAMAAGVPVVTYEPIAGHGRDNADAMVEAGITEQPRDPVGLAEAIDRLARPGAERDRRIAAGIALFAADPVELILEAATKVPQ